MSSSSENPCTKKNLSSLETKIPRKIETQEKVQLRPPTINKSHLRTFWKGTIGIGPERREGNELAGMEMRTRHQRREGQVCRPHRERALLQQRGEHEPGPARRKGALGSSCKGSCW